MPPRKALRFVMSITLNFIQMKNLTILALITFSTLVGSSQNLLPAPSLIEVQKKQVDSSITLKWEAPAAQILGYVIEKREDDGNWLIVAQTEPGEKSFTDKVFPATQTYYRIRSFGNKLLSDYSNIKCTNN